MKERKLMLLAMLVTMMLPLNMFAQKDDFGMWFAVGAEKKIDTKWSVGVNGEFRTRNNMKTADRWSLDVSGTYKVTNWLKASAGYVLLYDNNEKKTYYDDVDDGIDYGKVKRYAQYWGLRHRFNVSLSGSVKLGRFNVSLRERWQYTYRPEKTVSSRTRYLYNADGSLKSTTTDDNPKTYNGKGKNVLRSRLQVSYDIPSCKIDPYVSVEAYNNWSIEKVRYTAGAEWKISKTHAFDLYYRYQNIRNNDGLDDDPDIHIIGLGYKFKF